MSINCSLRSPSSPPPNTGTIGSTKEGGEGRNNPRRNRDPWHTIRELHDRWQGRGRGEESRRGQRARRRKKTAAIRSPRGRLSKIGEAIADWPPLAFEGGLPSSSLLPPPAWQRKTGHQKAFFQWRAADKRRSIATRVSPAHGERIVVGGGYAIGARERERDNL